MKRELSILIPVYNAVCTALVQELCSQAAAIEGLQYEVIVAEDGSTDSDTVAANEAIAALPHCRHTVRAQNSGRSAIRNFLARESRYRWLLFIDCDMAIVSSDYLLKYLECDADEVVDGGVSIGIGPHDNLRYRYEKAAEPMHTAEQRRKQPYKDFHTANFLIRRDLMLSHPFDERFRTYGYEDVLLGKELRRHGITICHISNPAGFNTFESNVGFVAKTEEGMRTLHTFRNELRGYNNVLTLSNGIHLGIVRSAIRLWHRLAGPLERRNLCGRHPSLTLFNLYKIGYYITLTNNDNDL